MKYDIKYDKFCMLVATLRHASYLQTFRGYYSCHMSISLNTNFSNLILGLQEEHSLMMSRKFGRGVRNFVARVNKVQGRGEMEEVSQKAHICVMSCTDRFPYFLLKIKI